LSISTDEEVEKTSLNEKSNRKAEDDNIIFTTSQKKQQDMKKLRHAFFTGTAPAPQRSGEGDINIICHKH